MKFYKYYRYFNYIFLWGSDNFGSIRKPLKVFLAFIQREHNRFDL